MGCVEDKTGLTGKYDFTLKFAGLMAPGGALTPPSVDDGSEDSPPLFQALEEQLGLKLVEKKLLLDVVVIDRVDKVPTEN